MIRIVVLALLLASPLAAQIETPDDALSRCFADNTTGKDRKDLARWTFFALAAHPEIKPFTKPSVVSARKEGHRLVAATFMRLLTESCAPQVRAAYEQGDVDSIEAAFLKLGELSMQELMSNREVEATMSAFEKYLDIERLDRVLGNK